MKPKPIVPKRENWNNNYRWVIRDEKGRFLSSTKYKKGVTKAQISSKFNQDRTLKEGYSKISPYTYEISFKPDQTPKGAERWQYFVKVKVKGKILEARSPLHIKKRPEDIAEAKQQALERAVLQGEEYDYDTIDSEIAFTNASFNILDEGIVGYAKV